MRDSIIKLTCEQCGSPYLEATQEETIYKCDACESLFKIKKENDNYYIEEQIEKISSELDEQKLRIIVIEIDKQIQDVDKQLKSIQPELERMFPSKSVKKLKKELIERSTKLTIEKMSLENQIAGIDVKSGRIYLHKTGKSKLNVVKTIKQYTSTDLFEAKRMADMAPAEITDINNGEAELLYNELVAIGNGIMVEFI